MTTHPSWWNNTWLQGSTFSPDLAHLNFSLMPISLALCIKQCTVYDCRAAGTFHFLRFLILWRSRVISGLLQESLIRILWRDVDHTRQTPICANRAHPLDFYITAFLLQVQSINQMYIIIMPSLEGMTHIVYHTVYRPINYYYTISYIYITHIHSYILVSSAYYYTATFWCT